MIEGLNLVTAAGIFDLSADDEGLVIGVIAAGIVCSICGSLGIFLTRRLKSTKPGILIQVPPMLIGLVLAITGLVLVLTEQSRPMALGLLAGGALATLDCGMFLFLIPRVHKQRMMQKDQSDK